MMMTLITVLKPSVLHCAAQPISVLWSLAWLPADLALLSLGQLRMLRLLAPLLPVLAILSTTQEHSSRALLNDTSQKQHSREDSNASRRRFLWETVRHVCTTVRGHVVYWRRPTFIVVASAASSGCLQQL